MNASKNDYWVAPFITWLSISALFLVSVVIVPGPQFNSPKRKLIFEISQLSLERKMAAMAPPSLSRGPHGLASCFPPDPWLGLSLENASLLSGM